MAGGGPHSIVCGKWLYSYWERCVAELDWAALGTARWRQGCPSLPVVALPAACDAVRFLLSSAIAASFGSRQQGERWLFWVHLIRTVRYIPALATQTDIHHPTDPFLTRRWDGHWLFSFFHIQHDMIHNVQVHKIVIEILMTKRYIFSPSPLEPSLACPVFSILACNKCLLCVLGLFRHSHVSNQDRMLREGRTKQLPLADALHLGPSKLFRPCRVDPMRETPERSVAEGQVPNPFTHMAAGRQASRSGFKLRLVVSLLVGC